ncbi:MAG: hypothetical protein WC690_06710, partial [bacterium]
VAIALFTSFDLWAAQPEPRLILNAPSLSHTSLDNFRRSNYPFTNPPGSAPLRDGLSTLDESGSAQFSGTALKELREKLAGRKITVVDLRQESHGFINGEIPVSWYANHDWANLGKSLQEIEQDERERQGELLSSGRAEVGRKSADAKRIDVKVGSVSTEKELVEKGGLTYFRIPVPDHRRPDAADVDRFVELVRFLPEGQWLHFHCEAGEGRTTMFMAMYDMMRNAKAISFRDILQRQYVLGGIDLRKLGPVRSWQHKYSAERLNFLKRFYAYAKVNGDGFETSWTKWLAQNAQAERDERRR